jgi:hypothetical protein
VMFYSPAPLGAGDEQKCMLAAGHAHGRQTAQTATLSALVMLNSLHCCAHAPQIYVPASVHSSLLPVPVMFYQLPCM